jgi:pimeloyl-[acyl-carrier protein] synthase
VNAYNDLADVDLQSGPQIRGQAFLDDMDQIRDTDPVHWSPQSHCWILTQHQDVSDLFMGRLPLRHSGRIEAFSFAAVSEADRVDRIPNLSKYVPQWIINLDGERHQRVRSLLVHAFSRRIVERVREFARERSNALLDQAVQKPSVEFNEEIARSLTGHVLFKLIGLPDSKFPALKDWATALVEGLGSGSPSIERLERAEWSVREMNSAVRTELKKRKIRPQDDLMTSLLQATENGEQLTVDELLAQMQVIIVAGHDTTANTMTLGLEALQRHPAAWRQLYEHPDRIQQYIAELQRYTAMSGGQALLASEDFELHGKQIKRGQVVVGAIMAADRDPLRFADATRLDFTRNNKDSLVFAPGPHFCLGHMLAKMQLAEFFLALVKRVECVELLDDKLNFMPVFTFRGLYSLNVRFSARRVKE